VFPSSGEGETNTFLDSLERADLNDCITIQSLVFGILDNGQSPETQ
jgi:hypothetical protein